MHACLWSLAAKDLEDFSCYLTDYICRNGFRHEENPKKLITHIMVS